jgi:Raf kinase inhibitor-like YbhB/YbcL family protein
MPRALLPLLLCSALASCGAKNEQATRPMADFQLTSSAFRNGAAIPQQFTCEGTDQQPPLEWAGAPAGTRSFVLIVDDPDAPGGTFRHWGAYGIPADAGSMSGSPAQAVNDFGKPGYGGPCPPKGHGPHHYRFRLLALDTDRLNLLNPKIAQLEAEAEKHVIARAELVGTYERK